MNKQSRTTGDGLWLFFGLTFALSWVAWLSIPLLGSSSRALPGVLLYMAGGFGPSIIGVILFYRHAAQPERKDFWRRLWDARQVRSGWFGHIGLVFLTTTLLAILLDWMFSGQTALPGSAGLKEIFAQPAALIPTLVIGILFGPLAEELGWRGFALDRLVARWGLVRASLILGVIWWAWHLPLFLIPGTTHYAWGLWTLPFWIFLPTVIGLSVLIAWSYQSNGRSLFAAVLIHFAYNFILSLIYPVSAQFLLIYAVLLAVWVMEILLGWQKQQRQTLTPVTERS